MPYIPITNQADREFAADADIASGRVMNDTGWRGNTIFSDNMAALNSLPGQARLQELMLDRGNVLAQARTARTAIAVDDRMLADENAFNAFNDGLGDLTPEQYNEQLASAQRADPTNLNLKAARDALNSSVVGGAAIRREGFSKKQDELSLLGLQRQEEMQNDTFAMENEAAIKTAEAHVLKSGLDLNKAKTDYTGTSGQLQVLIGSSGLSDDIKEQMSSIVQVLGDDPKNHDARSVINSLVMATGSTTSSGQMFDQLIRPYEPVMERVQQLMGFDPSGQPFNPMDPSPAVRSKLQGVLQKNPQLARRFGEAMKIQNDYSNHKKNILAVEQSLPVALTRFHALAKEAQKSGSQVELNSDLGRLRANSYILIGAVEKQHQQYVTDHSLAKDKATIDAIETRLRLSLEAGNIAQAKLELALLHPEKALQLEYLKTIMASGKEKKYDPTKMKKLWDDTLAESKKMSSEGPAAEKGADSRFSGWGE